MSFEHVTSREYKLMLQPDRFAGDEEALLLVAGKFWEAYIATIGELVEDKGSLDKIEHRRAIKFFDTADHRLYETDYAFRVRQDRGGDNDGDREATLKFRHQDRYIAAGRDVDAADDQGAKTKFEEDIKPPFRKLFSHSTKQPIDDDKFRTLGDVAARFPGLAKDLDGYDEKEAIDLVGFTAHEIVITGGELKLGKKKDKKAECALIVWYGEALDQPAVAEFSFKYSNDREKFGTKVASRAFSAFELVQAMNEWVDPRMPPLTKTKFIYQSPPRNSSMLT